MSRQLHAQVDIQASPERVWEALTDFDAYAEWNPFIVQAAGRAVPGSRLELRMRLPGRRPTSFRPEVLDAEPGRRLRWLGRLLLLALIGGPTLEGFHRMNQALRSWVEAPTRTEAPCPRRPRPGPGRS